MQEKIPLTELELIIKSQWPAESITNVHEFEEGYNNVAYLVTTSQRKVAVKLIKRKDSEINAKHEAHAFAMLKEKYPEIPLPTVIVFDDTRKLIDKVYSVSTFLEGKPLNKEFKHIGNLEQVYTQLGEIRAKIHAIKYPQFGMFDDNFNLVPMADPADKVSAKVEKAFAAQAFSPEMRAFWNENKKFLYAEDQPCLCHGDAGQSNILVTDSKITGILDFEFVQVGRRMNDVITFYDNFERIEEVLSYVQKGYERHLPLPQDWKKIFYTFSFGRYVHELGKSDTLAFRNRTEQEMEDIRRAVKEKSIRYLNLIMDNFEK